MRSRMKKSMAFAVAVALIATALPAGASAARLETQGGVLLSKGMSFTATSTNFTFNTSYGTLKCSKVVLRAEVTQNNGTTVEAVEAGHYGGGPSFAEACTSNGQKFPLQPAVHGLKLDGTPGNGTLGLAIDWKLGGFECHNENNAIAVSYTPGGSILRMVNGKVNGPPVCGPFTANADFSITETVSGNPLILK